MFSILKISTWKSQGILDNVLLFITGVLSGLIAGFLLSRIFGRTKIRSDGSTEGLLQERLLKADDGLKKFSDELEAYKKELKETQIDAQKARETSAVSSTQLKAVTDEKELFFFNFLLFFSSILRLFIKSIIFLYLFEFEIFLKS